MRSGKFGLLCLGILASSFLLLAGCGGSPTPVGAITVTPAATTVDGTDATTLTATVTNDRNAAGVSWSTSAGTLSGTSTTGATITLPAATGSSQTVTITATSVADTTKTGTATITVPVAPAVTSLTAPQQSVAVGTTYSVTLAGTGGISPYKNWALAAGTLPACLSLNASTGVLSSPSIPTAACVGVYSGIKFSMSDSGTATALTATSSAQTITVTGPTLAFSSTLPAGSVGTAYAGSVTASGALGATTYSLASGALPASGHLTLNAATGAITGTPYAADAGTFNFTVKVVDQYGDTATSGALSITINAPTLTFPASLGGGNVGTAYSASVAATGAVGTTTYTVNSGALPASGHITLNAASGAISGTPYAADAGTSTFTIKVTDQYGDTATSGSLSINITAPTLTFSTPSAAAPVGTAYSSSAAANGAAGTATYSLASGALPASGHLVLNTSTGAITGTPYAADDGPYTFTVKVTDQYGDTATSGTLSITVASPAISFPISLPGGNVGTAYSASVAGSGPVGATTYVVNSGALPASGHVTLNAATGAITGTPYAADAGTSTFTIKVTDQYGDTATSGPLSITITAPAITFATPAATANVGSAYASSAAASGTVGATTYAINSGSLPASGHLAFNTSTGAIAGTPYNADKGTSTFTVSVTDQYGDTATSGSLSINVIAPTITFGTPAPTATVGTAYSSSAAASGTVGTTTYAIAGGSLPASGHLLLNPGTGAIAGTPYAGDVGPFNFTVSVTDQYGDTATSGTFTITITAPLITLHATLPPGAVGTAYTGGVSASGAAGTTTYAVTGGAVGASGHLTLDPSTGAITGTPYASDAGTSSFQVTVEDQYGDIAGPFNENLVINPAGTITFGAAPTATATDGVKYSSAVTASGGAGTLTYSLVGAGSSNLPSDFALNPSTGAVSGTPANVSPFTFEVQAADAYGDTPATQSYTVTVSAGVGTKLLFSTEPPANGTAGTPFGVVVQVEDVNGFPVNTSNISVTITSTPSGVTVATTSTVNGVATFTNLLLDTSGAYTLQAAAPGLTGANSSGITIGAGTASKLVFSTEPPANVTVGTPFGAVIEVEDGNNNLVTSSSASVTITSTASGVTGTTTVAAVNGFATFTNLMLNSSATFTLQANANLLAGANSTNVTASNALTINQTVLPSADQGLGYSFTLTASGGSGSGYTFTTQGASTLGNFGLTLDSSGLIHGTPTNGGGTATFTAQVTDSLSHTATQALSIPVYSGLSLPSPDPSSLPSTGLTNQTYTGSINGVGGTGTYQWSVNGTVVTGAGVSLGNGTLTATASGNILSINGAPSSTSPVSFNVRLTDTAANNVFTNQGPYTITISNPTSVSLPTPSATVPGSAVVNQSYTGSITATGGVPPYTWTINGQPTTGAGYSFGNGTLVATSSGNTLTFGGTPTSATTIGPFTVNVTDSALPSSTFANNNYSIVVNPNGGTINGAFSLQNYCNGGGTIPVTFTVTLTNTSTSQTIQTTSISNGSYSFSSVPPGTYTITPSIAGAAAVFYASDPAMNTGIVVTNGTNLLHENFNAQVGYTVSGSVSYSGTQTGQTFINLSGGCGSGGSVGTALLTTQTTGNGSFTIRGVQPGNYTLSAWMDPLGNQVSNAIDPTGSTSSGSITVSNANVSGTAVTMHDPTFATPYENPSIKGGIIPNSQGVLIEFSESKNNSGNGIEDANQYVVQWSTSPTVGGGSGGDQFLCAEHGNVCPSHTFAATGDKGVWLLNNANLGAGTFVSGTTYYFQARSFNTLASTTHPNGWCDYDSSSSNGCSPTPTTTSSFTGVTIGTPACSGTCTAVSSSVTIPASLTCPTNTSVTICPGAPLYLGLVQLDPSTGNPTGIYVTEIANPVVGVNNFPSGGITVPNGSNYAVIGILDQLNNGGFGVGAVSNTNHLSNGNLTISSSTPTVPGITLPTTNSVATVATQYNSYTCQGCGGTQTYYQLNFNVEASNRLPVAVTLTSGPNVINTSGTVAIDMSNSNCNGCGSPQFQYSALLPGGTPSLGDTYGFTVKYSDGTSDNGSVINGAVTPFGGTVANGGTGAVVGPADLPTLTSPASGTTASSDTPTFTWTDPSLANPGNYYYSFYLNQQSGTCLSGNCQIWQIPNENGNSNGFNNSITSLTWNVDPISGDNSSPTVTSLTSGQTYSWAIQVQDSNNSDGNSANQAQRSVWFVAP